MPKINPPAGPMVQANAVAQNAPAPKGRFYKFASATSTVTGAILNAPSTAWNVAEKITGAVVRPVVHVLGTTVAIAKEASGVGSFQRAGKTFEGKKTIWVNNQGERVGPNYQGKKIAVGTERSNVIVRSIRAVPDALIGTMAATASSAGALKVYSLITTNEGTLLSGALNLASSAANSGMNTFGYLGNVALSGIQSTWKSATMQNITNMPSAIVTGIEQTTTSIAGTARYTTNVALRSSLGIVSLAAINTAAKEYLKAADSQSVVGKLGHGIVAVASLGTGILAGAAAYSPAVLAGVFESQE